ncbi:MAG: multiple monosaccharide ABC transporter ATP-binding protein [Pseudotabrizicola sp.]|uniref:multiple monosaccharide ABC transporter ATP-binding protein n=2 Tax=Pseudotabrizicola sp. TaxID=2939647 RepID=UPI00272F1B7D|nr:multiple monosaccharide ABC transporter ATP-binding protein [Pseudotabrizicola sp.]MDP2082575.1 sugar ABC transporter ATP-binding protein [Pseudotabrizicola sp.]MDZ7573914.1 multiple monosaccharide ABC transporter ATP-binding protein [Pseudotabrizicola sp.]
MTTLLEMRGISKLFPGVRALDQVNLSVEAGEIHAICGENGAGKSTLMKVLSGVYPHGSYEGDIVYDGGTLAMKSITDSESKGIIIIHQELALVPLLSIAENLFLGNEVAKGGVINWPLAFQKTRDLLQKVGLNEAPTTIVGKLGVGKQQLIEIAKALAKDVRLLILDEPTAALQENDSQKLLDLMLELKAQGVTQIIISHKLNEIGRVADRITIIRDGTTVSTLNRADISEDRIIRDMVGRDMAHRYPDRTPNPGEVLLEVKNWNVFHPDQKDRQMIRDAAFTVRKGEIVGIAGLMGAGRTELAMSLFGRSYGRGVSGEITMGGKPVDTSTVTKAVAAGLAYVTEDRKALGLILEEPISRNISLANLAGIAMRGVLNQRREAQVAEDYRRAMNIRTPNVQQKVVNLSGGNQQKVVLSKWLFTDPQVLILDEPTRGIDVGAKFEIYNIMNQLAADGRGIVMISSEMPELLGMCDRIYVMNEGRIVGELSRAEASQERIMAMIMNSTGKAA